MVAAIVHNDLGSWIFHGVFSISWLVYRMVQREKNTFASGNFPPDLLNEKPLRLVNQITMANQRYPACPFWLTSSLIRTKHDQTTKAMFPMKNDESLAQAGKPLGNIFFQRLAPKRARRLELDGMSSHRESSERLPYWFQHS